MANLSRLPSSSFPPAWRQPSRINRMALFGGNISGRRLRGVKINPIYQENDPGGREGQDGDTQSESALPIGEIQIEVYESLPRSYQRSYGPPSAECGSCGGKEDGCAGASSCSAHGSGELSGKGEKAGSCSERGGCCKSGGKDDFKMCPGVTGFMGVDSLPWSFLQERSTARREPVWGAFRGMGDKKLPELSEDSEDGSDVVVHKKPLEASSSSSSECRRVMASFEELVISSEEETDVGVNVLESSGEGEPPGDFSASSGFHEKENCSNYKLHKSTPSEYQAYYVTMSNNSPFLAQGTLPYGMFDAYPKANGKNGYADLVSFAEHNLHHYGMPCLKDSSGLEKEGSDIPHEISGKNGVSVHYPVFGGNGLKKNGMISPEDGHVLCACPCHSQLHRQESQEMAGSILTDDSHEMKNYDKTENSDKTDAVENRSPETGSDDSGIISSECKDQDEPLKTKDETDLIKSFVNQCEERGSIVHEHSETCMMDFENNNNCLVLYKVRKEDLRPDDFYYVKESDSVIQKNPTDNGENTDDSKQCPETGDEKNDDDSVCPKDDAETVVVDSENDENTTINSDDKIVSSQTENGTEEQVGEGSEKNICKLCGCPRIANHLFTMTAVTPSCLEKDTTAEMTSPYLHTLSNGSILLRADELNAPSCLQHYLLEAQKHYLQRQQAQHYLYDDSITTYTSTSLPTPVPTPVLTTPRHVSDLIIPDTGELREDINFNLDSVSYIEELGCCALKNSTTKKSFKGGSNSKATSKQSSRTSSRQSSRNSKGTKHCSIEDLDAELEDEERMIGEGSGSQCGGSCSRSASFVDRNANLKKAGLSIIHIGGTTADPAFEMIVPYEEDPEEESKYSSRRRQRLEEMAEEKAWKEEQAPLRDRVIKATLCTVLFCVFIGIFIGVAIHFGKGSTSDDPTSGGGDRGMISGSVYGMR